MHPIYTIGHSNHSMVAFVSLLTAHNIGCLIDVRSKPYSKYQPHFCRNPLATSVIAEGIEYLYGGRVLGGLNEVSISSPEFLASMTRIMEISETKPVALMCSEKDPKTCHRAMKLTAWVHAKHPDLVCAHIIPGQPLMDSKKLQQVMKPTWGWHELFPEGTYGKESSV